MERAVGAISGFTDAERKIYAVQVSDTVIEGWILGQTDLTAGDIDPDNQESDQYVIFRITLTDDADNELDPGRVGNIQLRGASVTERVYGDEAATAALFTGGTLATD